MRIDYKDGGWMGEWVGQGKSGGDVARHNRHHHHHHLAPPALLSCFTSSQVAAPNPSLARWTEGKQEAGRGRRGTGGEEEDAGEDRTDEGLRVTQRTGTGGEGGEVGEVDGTSER